MSVKVYFSRCSLCGSTDNFKCPNCFGRYCWDCTTVYFDDKCKHEKLTEVPNIGWDDAEDIK